MGRLREAAREHPWIAAVLVGGALLGAGLGWFHLDPGWHPLRRVLAGALAGGGIGFLMTATRMLGEFE